VAGNVERLKPFETNDARAIFGFADADFVYASTQILD